MIKACLVQIRPLPPAASADHLHGCQDALILRASLSLRGAARAGPASGQSLAEALQLLAVALPLGAAAGAVVVKALGQDVVIIWH